MTVYQAGYICAVCGPVTAKLWWSNEENDLVASCTKCGQPIQRVIAIPYSTPLATQLDGQSGGPGHDAESNSLKILAPATPTEEDT